MTKLMIAAAAVMLVAVPVQAQSHDHAGSGAAAAETGHECPMHAAGADHANDPAHRYAPKMLLKHTDMLKLTPEQTSALEKLQAEHKRDCEQHMAGAKKAEENAAALLAESVVDLQKYEASVREAAEQKIRCRVSMAALGQQAKALLSAEQIAHLAHMSHAGHQ